MGKKVGFFNKLFGSRQATHKVDESIATIQQIVPIQQILCIELVFVKTKWEAGEREWLKESDASFHIFKSAWPELYDSIDHSDLIKTLRFSTRFAFSWKESIESMSQENDRLNANVILHARSVRIGKPQVPSKLIEYDVELRVYLAGRKAGEKATMIAIAHNHRLLPLKENESSKHKMESRGRDFTGKVKKCLNCGEQLKAGSLTCSNCGSERFIWE